MRQNRSIRPTVSNEMRLQMARLQLSGMSNSAIARQLGFPRTTVSTILKRFSETGCVEPKKRGGDFSTLLTLQQKEKVLSWVDEDATLTLKSLKVKVEREFSISVSVSTIDRVLGQFHYSLKRLVAVPERRNCEKTIEERSRYAEMFRELESSKRHKKISSFWSILVSR